jgi:hypothetical protein
MCVETCSKLVAQLLAVALALLPCMIVVLINMKLYLKKTLPSAISLFDNMSSFAGSCHDVTTYVRSRRAITAMRVRASLAPPDLLRPLPALVHLTLCCPFWRS